MPLHGNGRRVQQGNGYLDADEDNRGGDLSFYDPLRQFAQQAMGDKIGEQLQEQRDNAED